MRKLLTLILPAVFVFASSCGAQAAERLELSFSQGIEMLLENNLDLSVQRIEPRIADARVLSAIGGFDMEVFGSFSRQDRSTPLSARSSVAAGGLSSVESESYGLEAGLTGKTYFGTEYTLKTNSSWTADTFNDFEFQYESFSGVSITQPLLRGFGEASLLEVTLARKDREISGHELGRAILDAVSGYGEAWWALMEARSALAARVESLKLAEVLLYVNRKKLEAGAISRLELVQAESAAASRKEDVLVAEKAVQSGERALKELLSKDAYAISGKEIVPVGDGTLRPAGGSLREAVNSAIEARPEYLEAKSVLERNNIEIRYTENQTYPEVDLEASYGYNGLGDSFSDSFSNLDDNPEWRLGLLFRYPLGSRGARGELEAARLQALQSKIRLKRIEQGMILKLDEALKEIATDAKRLEAAGEAVRLAEETLSAEEKKLEAGRSTTFNVLRIQDDLLQSRLKRLAAVSDYNKVLLRFYREKGTLLEELGINIKSASEVR